MDEVTLMRPVFLFDVDNTLLDNDRITADLRRYLGREVGAGPAEQYFEFFEELRRELGYADYLGALQRYRMRHPRDPHLLAVSSFLVNYPFANRLFPGSLDAIEHVAAFGAAVILSDGDVVHDSWARSLASRVFPRRRVALGSRHHSFTELKPQSLVPSTR
jgi:FMN phosphatase YigB (HAD superfamily)